MKLDILKESFPLPREWMDLELFEQEVSVGELTLNLAGIKCAHPTKGELFGSAGSRTGNPLDRAYFELLERIALRDFKASPVDKCKVFNQNAEELEGAIWNDIFPESLEPELWQYSQSNGVAVGRTWKEACDASLGELVERDAVLYSFYKGVSPRIFEAELFSSFSQLPDYDWSFCEFPRTENWKVAGVVGFPKTSSFPLVYGFGAGKELSVAFARAEREAFQRLGFLWGEEIPQVLPNPASTPDYHQNYYLCSLKHQVLKNWLLNSKSDEPFFERALEEIFFCDITPPHLRGQISVVKAFSRQCLPLFFGTGAPSSIWELVGKNPLLVHPIA